MEQYKLRLQKFLLTFENLCEHEENCLISKLKSSSLVSSSSSVSIWWYFSERAIDKSNKIHEFIRKINKNLVLFLRLFLLKCQLSVKLQASSDFDKGDFKSSKQESKTVIT